MLTLCEIAIAIDDSRPQIWTAGYENACHSLSSLLRFLEILLKHAEARTKRTRPESDMNERWPMDTSGSDRDWWSPTFVLGRNSNLEKRKSTMTRSIRSASHKVDCSSFGKCAILSERVNNECIILTILILIFTLHEIRINLNFKTNIKHIYPTMTILSLRNVISVGLQKLNLI